MRFELVSTRNVQRIMDALKALQPRLSDPEYMGMGLIYGRPGLGKSMAIDAYVARTAKTGRSRVAKVRAMAHWTEASMMKAILVALGPDPRGYRMDLMMDQIIETLSDQPAMILIDEMDSIAGSRKMAAVLKDIHDVTGSAICMIGEERVDGILRRYQSFYNRMNSAAIVQCMDHDESDVRAVVDQRCEFPVDPKVSAEIYQLTGGKSMRSVIDSIRQMEEFARANGLTKIGLSEYRASCGRTTLKVAPTTDPPQSPRQRGEVSSPLTGRDRVGSVPGMDAHPTLEAVND